MLLLLLLTTMIISMMIALSAALSAAAALSVIMNDNVTMMTTAAALHRKTLVSDAARELEKSKMARFDEKSGNLYVTELGRVASHFYIRHSSIVIYNDLLKRHMSEAEVWHLFSTTANLNMQQGTLQQNLFVGLRVSLFCESTEQNAWSCCVDAVISPEHMHKA